ncbi:MAG: hypothetical protein U0325_17840 [Polyangiales bacterium]
MEHEAVVARVAGMVRDASVVRLARGHGLHVVNVMWEDCARYLGSSVGPNISDLSLQVQHARGGDGRLAATLLPVLRPPNFRDRTGDIALDRLFVLAGNHAGAPLELVSLRELLGDLRRFLSNPTSWAGDARSLLAPDEMPALVSAQACFLPVPKGGVATFNPVLFNYQSRPGDPAVLCVLATPEGTSATVVDNARDAFAPGQTWGQRLYVNVQGQRASLTGRRRSEVAPTGGDAPGGALPGGAVEVGGVNVVLLVQVPLRQRARRGDDVTFGAVDTMEMERGISAGPDLEDAVIGHGELEGPFREIDGLAIERDPRFPVRVTVQFYKATSTGVVSRGEMIELAETLARVYDDAEATGSLVLDGPRANQPGVGASEPPGWWDDFWDRFERDTGTSRVEAVAGLRGHVVVGAWTTEWELRRALRRLGHRRC